MTSYPDMEDSDEDGLEDDEDPHPLNDDLEIKELKKKSYIRIKYYDVVEWPGFGETSDISYGSSQDWFDNYWYLNDDYDWSIYTFWYGLKKYKEKYDNYIHLVSEKGCGLIAISDLAIYLAYNDPNIDLQNNKLYDPVNDYFDYISYMEYLFEMLNRFPILCIPTPYNEEYKLDFGNIDTMFSHNYIEFLNTQLTDNYIGAWNLSDNEESFEKALNRMITNDIPVIISYDKSTGNGVELPLYKEITDTDPITTVSSHYMIVTGILKYSDDVDIEKAHISCRTMLQVSSWEQKFYIPYDKYVENLSLFTNLFNLIRL